MSPDTAATAGVAGSATVLAGANGGASSRPKDRPRRNGSGQKQHKAGDEGEPASSDEDDGQDKERNEEGRKQAGEEEGDDDDDEEEEDEDDATPSDSDSNYSTASEDQVPPIHEYGHMYHGSGRMVTPNDACENSRQGYQHELFCLCLGGALTYSKLPLPVVPPSSSSSTTSTSASSFSLHQPPPPPFHILDVGAGGGHWAMAMARSNPLVDVLGIELSSANLPKQVPANLTFEIADAAEPWPPRLYDFIHMRNLVGGGIRDWKRLLEQAFAHLKPGGQLEFTEATPLFFGVDPVTMEAGCDAQQQQQEDKEQKLEREAETPPQQQQEPDEPPSPEDAAKPRAAVGAACLEFGTHFAEISARQGIDFDPAPKVATWLTELGAASVRERTDWLPVRDWSSDPVMRKKGEILSKMLDSGEGHVSPISFCQSEPCDCLSFSSILFLYKKCIPCPR